MKTITKLIHINDGNYKTVHNGNRLFVETSPRTERIISAFLTDGWVLHSRVFNVSPSTTPDRISFYLSGWDFLFTKEIPDDAEDESDMLLKEAVLEALEMEEEESFEEEMDWEEDPDSLPDT
jgi:hypothetical protein